MLPGLDSTKEELQATAEYLLARGMATLAIDGPGQGEAAYDLPIEPAYEKVATAVVDYLATRADVDGGNVGLFGISLGGYYAARAAAREKRLRAVVDLAGPYRLDLDWDELPAQTRDTFRVRSGAASDDEARAKAGTLTLEEAAGEITTPLLILGGGRDRLTPAYHQERLASEVASAELVIVPGRQPRRDQPRLRVPLPAGRLAGRPPARITTRQRSEAGRRVDLCAPPRCTLPRVAAARRRDQAEGPVPSVSVVVCDWPEVSVQPTEILSPGWSGISAWEIWVPVVTAVPLIAVITSPSVSPAAAAGVPGWAPASSTPEVCPVVLAIATP